MNTYRVYVLSTTNPLAPLVAIAYVQGEKYRDAWMNARGALNGKVKNAKLFNEPEAKTEVKFEPDSVVAKIDDIRPRNVKLDKAKLQEILKDPKASAEDKLAAMTAMLA